MIVGDTSGNSLLSEVGVLILDIIKKKKSARYPLGQWIKDFSNRLGSIENKLTEIKLILTDLKVYIEQMSVKDAEIKLLSECTTVRNLFDYYKTNIAKQEVRAAVLQKFQTVNTSSNILRQYSYATVYTVSFAFLIELEMMLLLGMDRRTIHNVSQEYCKYFKECLEEARGGTPAFVLAATKNTLKKLETEFSPGDKGIIDGVYNFKGNSTERCRCAGPQCQKEIYYTVWNYYRLIRGYFISGDIKRGFTVQFSDLIQKNYLGTRDPGSYNNEAAATEAMTNYLQSLIAHKYNNACVLYNQFLLDLSKIEDVVAKAKEFQNYACSL